jgi:hypothetical protein
MRRAWDPQQPVETLFKQIQDCADYSEEGGFPIGPSQQINIGYSKIFATGHFISACRCWNKIPAAEKTWTHCKSNFEAAHLQHKKMQGESAATARYHSPSASMTHNEAQMAESTIGKSGNSNRSGQRCGGSPNSGQFSSCKATRGELLRGERIEGFSQSGTA